MYKQQITYSIIVSLLGIIVGLLFCFTDPNDFLRFIFVGIGIFVVISGVSSLLMNKYYFENEKNTNMILAIIQVVLGFVMIVYPHSIANIIVGVLLVALPVYKILSNNDKKETLKKEAVKLAIGLVILVCGIGSAINVILDILGIIIIAICVLYIIYNIIILIKVNKKDKQEQDDNEIIDV